jgi:polygalacturonase
MNLKNFCILSCILAGLNLSAEAKTVTMTQAGAVADGKTLNTAVIAKTIAELALEGGGTLFFPAGTYLTGPIELKSNITLDLESGAELSFSDDFDQYLPFVEMRFEGVVMKSFHPLLYAYQAENITIKGRGVLNGNGRKWWMAAWSQDGAGNKLDLGKYQNLWNQSNPGFQLEPGSDWSETFNRRFFRPPFFQAYKSKNIRIEGVKFTNSPFWTVNPEFCSNLVIDGITIDNPLSPNTDGINPESCDNVHIANCHISVGDDCITIKSGRDLQGRQLHVPCQNITITNCTMLAGHGGVVIGSEMSGDVRKVVISNCVFDGTDRGIRIKSTRGRGGIVEDIRVSNIVMRNIQKEAINLNLFYTNMPSEPVTERTPIFRNIHISNMTGVDVNAAGAILGLPEMPVSDISLTDIDLKAKTGFSVVDAKDIRISGMTVNTETGPAFVFERINEAHLMALKTNKPLKDAPVLRLKDCSNILIQNAYPLPGSKAYAQFGGRESKGIILRDNYLNRLETPILKTDDLQPNAYVLTD